jgi:hypothetical protein
MTAETDLPINDAVPAPTKIEPGNLFLWNWRQMQVYAQACVAHATAARDAEVEALRARLAEDRALLDAVRDAMGGGPYDTLPTRITSQAAALEAAREDAGRTKRDIAELYAAMPMLPITPETMDAATDWFTRYCIDFHREINAAHDAAIDQARGKAGQEVGNG